MDSLAVFRDKLDSQQPLFQRIAVKSVFDKLRSSPALAESAPGQEALMQCISSPHRSVVDQGVHEVCGLAKAQLISLGQAMNYLQTALDSAADASTVQIVVTGIGFLCRIAISRATTVADAAKAFTVHPLVKAVNSRDEASGELLQQVRLILLQPGRREQECALAFIKPFLAHVFIESSQLSFAHQLHSSLCSLAASNHVLGARLFDTLLQLVQHRSLLSSQNLETVCTALQELVEVLDILADSMEQFSGAVKKLMDVLFYFYEDTRKRNLSSFRVLSLIRRANAIALDILQPQELDCYLLLLAHRLVDSPHELEQLSILSLVLSWLQQDGNDFEEDRVLFLLSWVFPILYVLSFPSSALRELAFKLLEIVENIYMSAFAKFQERSRKSVSEVPEVRQTLLFRLWWQEPLNTWGSPSCMSTDGWLAKVDDLLTRNFPQVISHGFPFQLLLLLTSLMFHSTTTIAVSAIRIIALLGKKEPAWGMLLFPVLLFSLKICMRQTRRDEIVALLYALPDVSSHSTSLAFSMNIFQPMVDYKLDLADKLSWALCYSFNICTLALQIMGEHRSVIPLSSEGFATIKLLKDGK